MIPILAGLLVWYPALLGWGTPLLLLIRGEDPADNLVYAALGGMALLATLVTALNFMMPIGGAVTAVLFGAGWAALVTGQWRWRLWPRPSAGQITLASVLLVSIGVLAAQSPYNYETGLYHLQSVKWLTSSRVPYGLANMLGQFGFDSAWFSFAAALELPWLQGKSVFLANSLVVWVFGLAVGAAAARFSSLRQVSLSHTFLALAVLPWVGAVMSPNLTSLSADLPITLLTLLVSYLFIQALQMSDFGWRRIAGLLFIAIFAVTLKLSAVPLGLYALSLLGLAAYAAPAVWRPIALRVALFALCVGPLLVAPWVARNVALTGCLVYPVAATCMPALPWAVPIARIQSDAIYLQNWARGTPEITDSVSHDLGSLTRMVTPTFAGVVALIGCLAALLYVLGGRKGRTSPAYRSRDWLPIAIPLLGLGFWTYTAPDVRFGEGYLWCLGLYIFSLGLYKFYKAYELSGLERLVPAAGVVLGLVLIIAWPMFEQSGWAGDLDWMANLPRLRLGRGDLLWQWPALPEVRVTRLTLGPGNGYVYAPPVSFPCWDAPLPCSPVMPEHLKVVQTGSDLSGIYFVAIP